MLLLNKTLPVLVSPLGLFLLWSALMLVLRRPRGLWWGLALLYSASMPWTAQQLVRATEQQAVVAPAASMPKADVIVLLSGMARTVEGENATLVREWQDGVDRFEGALALWRAERAPKLLITAGRQPWDALDDTEGHWLQQKALERGIPPAATALTPPVQNTVEEAREVAALYPAGHVLLVTSAFHMPRAREAFEASGLRVTPYPVDLRAGVRGLSLQDFLPQADALAGTSLAVREWVGRGFYAVKQVLKA